MNTFQFSKRLGEVRELANLSQAALAKRLGISASLISHWEKGVREPSQPQLLEIAQGLGVSLDYLLNSELRPTFQFRAKSTLKAEQQRLVDRVLTEASQQVYFLDTIFRTAGKILKPFGLKADFSADELTNLTNQFREALRLNRRVSLEELKGALAEWNVFVFEWDMPGDVSGLSYRGATTVIIINAKHSPERKLFTLAHEFAHVLFHLWGESKTVVSVVASNRDPLEKQANQFASELLMPSAEIDQLQRELGSSLRQPVMLAMAAKSFNVSVHAMFYRLAGRGVFRWEEKNDYIEPWVEDKPMSEYQYRVSDPGKQLSSEFLRTAISLHESDKASAGKLAEWFFTPRIKVEEYLATLSGQQENVLGEGEDD